MHTGSGAALGSNTSDWDPHGMPKRRLLQKWPIPDWVEPDPLNTPSSTPGIDYDNLDYEYQACDITEGWSLLHACIAYI